MNAKKFNILIVDDEPNILKTMRICLQDMGLQITGYTDPRKALAALQETLFDLAFIDLKMRPIDGLELLDTIIKVSPQTTVVIITAHGTIDSAVQAIKKGAYDYLQKPFDFAELQLLTHKVLEYHRLKLEVDQLKERLSRLSLAEPIVTQNKRMLELVALAKRVADSELSVLLEGESGTGKELFAQLIHDKSGRASCPFIKINCAAIPENLLESELFGHVKGAFTGAVKNRKGRFEIADNGTIFFDEIAEITPALQAKLLRFLQQKEFEPVGSGLTRKVDVRVIAATNKNLDEALKEGTFREDLFYRLNAVRIRLLPLRERPEDIPLLIRYFAKKMNGDKTVTIEPEAMKALRAYHWSGNVRELRNVVERAIVLSKGSSIRLQDLPEELVSAVEKPARLFTLEETEKQHIKKVLQFATDYREAAEILGIDQATLWRKRKRYDI